ncbi:MAG: glycosyltransferase family 25 protein [Gemmataceae bacterium]
MTDPQLITVHYLNLARRVDRRERFLKENQGLARFERVEGIVGAELCNEDLIRDRVIQEPLKKFTPGALGNALSHKLLWERAASEQVVLTVAEDDALFNRSFAQKASGVLQRLPADWDLILWGWNMDSFLHVKLFGSLQDAVTTFDPLTLRQRIPAFREQAYDVVPLRLIGAFALVCYSVSPKGAKSLLELCFPLTNESIFIRAIDRMVGNFAMSATMNRHYADLNAYACYPPLVYTENDRADSDVITTRQQSK